MYLTKYTMSHHWAETFNRPAHFQLWRSSGSSICVHNRMKSECGTCARLGGYRSRSTRSFARLRATIGSPPPDYRRLLPSVRSWKYARFGDSATRQPVPHTNIEPGPSSQYISSGDESSSPHNSYETPVVFSVETTASPSSSVERSPQRHHLFRWIHDVPKARIYKTRALSRVQKSMSRRISQETFAFRSVIVAEWGRLKNGWRRPSRSVPYIESDSCMAYPDTVTSDSQHVDVG